MLKIFLAIFLSLALLTGASAQERVGAIRDVIERQLEAFQTDDFETAFGFASPAIQGMFDTPSNFAAMVRQGYPMVWRPGDVRFLDQAEINGETWQKLRIRDLQGNTHYLAYRMIETGDGWKINGVQPIEAPGIGV